MINFNTLDSLKQKLDSFRPLPPEIVSNLHEDLVLRWTYHSNAIEGNTLTLKETKVALEGITIGGKTMREHFEAINHREAIFFVEDLVNKNEPLSEWQIKSIHQLILKNIDDRNAGVYRKTNVIISGADHVPPDALRVESEMHRFISWYQTEGAEGISPSGGTGCPCSCRFCENPSFCGRQWQNITTVDESGIDEKRVPAGYFACGKSVGILRDSGYSPYEKRL